MLLLLLLTLPLQKTARMIFDPIPTVCPGGCQLWSIYKEWELLLDRKQRAGQPIAALHQTHPMTLTFALS